MREAGQWPKVTRSPPRGSVARTYLYLSRSRRGRKAVGVGPGSVEAVCERDTHILLGALCERLRSRCLRYDMCVLRGYSVPCKNSF